MTAASPADAEPHARNEIVRMAAEVFMEFGFAGTTIDAVAKRLGATKGRVYHYYRSKAELYFDIQMAAMERLLQEIRPIALVPDSPAKRLHRMALRHAEILLMDLPIQKVAVQGLERRLLLSLDSRHSKPLRSIIRLRDEYEQIFAEVIDEGSRAGVFQDLPCRLLTKPFFGAMNWATVWYSPRLLQTREEIAAIGGLLADFAMRGLYRESDTWPPE
jgi:AcrR family transcriptional regulator